MARKVLREEQHNKKKLKERTDFGEETALVNE